jgi:hypothetical protein
MVCKGMFLLLVLLFSGYKKAISQDSGFVKKNYTELHNLRKATINLLGIETGLEIEKKLYYNSTLTFFGGITFVRLSNKFADLKAPISLAGTTAIEYRNYYNFKNRLKKNKIILNNNANFFLVKTTVIFPISKLTYYNFFLSTGYGISRKILSKVNIETAIGITQKIAINDKKNRIKYQPNFQLIPFLKFNISLIF